jgi:hypothetical protein
MTRIEVSLNRTALKNLGVNSVQDLLDREQALIDLLTMDWLRILEKPKSKNRRKSKKLHPLWERVRALFRECFTGDKVRDVEYRKPTLVSGDPTPLFKQAAGCIAAAIARFAGRHVSLSQLVQIVDEWFKGVKGTIYDKAVSRAELMEIIKGIPVGLVGKSAIDEIRERVLTAFSHPNLHLRR